MHCETNYKSNQHKFTTVQVQNTPDILLIRYADVHRCDTRCEQDQFCLMTESVSITSEFTSKHAVKLN